MTTTPAQTSETPTFPTIERLANPANTTVGYQGPALVEEAVRCYHALTASQSSLAAERREREKIEITVKALTLQRDGYSKVIREVETERDEARSVMAERKSQVEMLEQRLWVANRRAESASARIAELEKDAARYRWLRLQSHPWGKKWYSLHVLDDHIDAALPAKD